MEKIRTEEDVLKDFEVLGYEVDNTYSKLTLINWLSRFSEHYVVVSINKQEKTYGKVKVAIDRTCGGLTIQEHKLLNELFTIWGWLE
jgi:hypothetical protein